MNKVPGACVHNFVQNAKIDSFLSELSSVINRIQSHNRDCETL